MPKYENIFSPETMASLKGKSGESLRQMLGNKNVMQAAMESQTLLSEVIEIEEPYVDELEMIAVQMVKDIYPVIDHYGLQIDAKITGMADINQQLDEEFSPEQKRRIVNGITQGASVRGAFGFLLFREYIDSLDPTLVDKYKSLMNSVFGTYDDDNAIAMFLAMIAQGHKMGGGMSKVIINEVQAPVIIKARAICFPMLVHEIIKGLYELVSLQGFSGTKDQNQAVVDKVDKLENEPHDLRYGKFIYDALNDIYAESGYDDSRIREFFFAEVYQLGDQEFVDFVENALNDELTPQQQSWIKQTLKEISMDIKSDDFDSTGLDEIKIK